MDTTLFRPNVVPRAGGKIPSGKRHTPRATAETERLALAVERAIRRRTASQVRNLAVRVEPAGRVIVSGWCPTFYCKQLAQTAAMDLLGSRRLFNQIEVR